MAKELPRLVGRTGEAEDRLTVSEFLATNRQVQRKQRQFTMDSNAKQLVIRLSEEDFTKLQSLSNCTTIPLPILCRALLRQAVSRYSPVGGLDDLLFQLSGAPPATSLSNREMDILNLIVQGVSNRVIANTLELSEQTVKNHVTSILHKMKTNNRIQAAPLALKHNLVRAGTPAEADLKTG